MQITCDGVDQAIAQMQGALDAIGGKRADKIIANAINQSLSAGRKEAARLARRAYTAPIKKLFENINVQRAKASDLQGQIELLGSKGVSMIHFKTNPREPGHLPPAGVTAQLKKKGVNKPRVSKNGGSKSFIMKKAQGGFGVFVRHGKDKWKNKKKIQKAKYEMLFGPSPIQYMQRRDAQEHVREKVEEAIAPRLQAEIDRALASLKGGR